MDATLPALTALSGVFFSLVLLMRLAGNRLAHPQTLATLVVTLFPLLIDASYRTRTFVGAETLTADWQVVMRLTGYALAALIGVHLMRRSGFHALRSRTLMPLMVLLLLGGVSVVWSLNSTYSLVSLYTWICTLLLGAGVVSTLNPMQVGRAFALSTSVYVAASFIAYFFTPLGRFVEVLSYDGTTQVARMVGLATHPNGLAIISLIGIGALLSQWRTTTHRRLLSLAVVMQAAALYLTLSRTSLAVMLIAVSWVYLRRSVWFYLLGGAGAALLFASGGLSIESISKGDGSDITNLTGRTELWPYALSQLEGIRLFIGGGWAASRPMLTGFSGGIFTHPHNAYLNALMVLGVPGLLAALTYLGGLFRRTHRSPFAAYVVIALILHGLMETSWMTAYAGTLVLTLVSISRSDQPTYTS
ncbi:O-antigen ligase family protein [Deinococcus sp. LM3]|uniref:O-antigen ligase family protein n=1 Tax=Deinococcus sp. LM3 TaxID=1938608 RepID=UPI000992AC4A|nr:O-antigen ligase family protein [Deinococcus sp. LM3]OOV11363.1 hypothetical protein BXU09_20060 [Deinococcus sp. LM3]